ncbi:hypothetical protein TNIN_369981 [Trichonephila inaurata madagascariensis]|uniref:Uncharacterized protein n=1 Tax=Trichonephila inaurata madagascariensis TaxID=2747483 RepID=A0A8X7C0J7_9ARAC|nr:hypothetical protein TNIN_369981 [Trichonephila inaurata madagascariensis]
MEQRHHSKMARKVAKEKRKLCSTSNIRPLANGVSIFCAQEISIRKKGARSQISKRKNNFVVISFLSHDARENGEKGFLFSQKTPPNSFSSYS